MASPYFGVNVGNTTYRIMDMDNTSKQIGNLYPREVCGRHQEHDGYALFLSSSGGLKDGLLDPNQNYKVENIKSHPYSREVIDGQEYLIYKMRRTMNVYRADASYWGKVAGGMYVATEIPCCGDTHSDWMQVNYVKSTKGNWVKVEGAGYNHGFVDTGFGSASGYNSWAIQANM